MQVRQVIAAALLAVTAVGAMAQEIDRNETLQAKNLAGQTQSADAGRSRASVVAETRNLHVLGQQDTKGRPAGIAAGAGSIWVTDAAPWRWAVPTQSAPVSPPPMTTTCLPEASMSERE